MKLIAAIALAFSATAAATACTDNSVACSLPVPPAGIKRSVDLTSIARAVMGHQGAPVTSRSNEKFLRRYVFGLLLASSLEPLTDLILQPSSSAETTPFGEAKAIAVML